MTGLRPRFGDERGMDAFSGGRGGWGRFVDRVFENPQSPLGWSFKLFVIWGITVRMHLMTAIYVASLLLVSIPRGNAGLQYMLPSAAMLLLLVLLHELGHCFACRLVGGEADRIVMLPFGGLALTRPPHHWKAHLLTTVGGPMVHILLAPLLIAALFFAGMGSTVVFHPLQPSLTVGAISSSSTLMHAVKLTLWWAHYLNVILLAMNLLLVMYPFDGGRIVQELMWSRIGYRRAAERAVVIGFAGAMVLALVALLVGSVTLVLLAVFGAASCWLERRRLRGEDELTAESFAFGSGSWDDANGDEAAEGPSRAERKRQEQEAREQEELDRILAKIAASGLPSLTRAESKTLERITQKKRGE